MINEALRWVAGGAAPAITLEQDGAHHLNLSIHRGDQSSRLGDTSRGRRWAARAIHVRCRMPPGAWSRSPCRVSTEGAFPSTDLMRIERFAHRDVG